MERAYNEGCRRFHFGVTNPENTGLIRFKRLWWTEEATLPYYYYPVHRGVTALPQTSRLYLVHDTFNKIMPTPILKLAGFIVYKHMG